jgi:glycosyltransferase involved in cell wall biosynthesis
MESKEGNVEILLLGDNSLGTVGGEQESTKIIINGIKNIFTVGTVHPGEIPITITDVRAFYLTNDTRIKHLVKKPISFIKYINGIRKVIKNTNPIVIHTQAQVSFFIVSLLKKLKLIPSRSIMIHTERSLYAKYNTFFKKVFKFFMSELDVLVATTEFNLKHWKQDISINYPNIEFKIIENTAGQLFEVFDEKLIGNEEGQIILGFAGRYCDWKNWPLAIEISNKLNEILGDRLRIKMALGCLDEKALEETKSMYNKLEQTFGSRFDGKINITLEEMDRFYYDIDVFVLTSNYNTESFGRTLVEAMSRKTVVLTTDAGGSVEVVGNLNNVCKTVEEFVERIMEFFRDKEKMIEEKERNLKRVRDIYSLENNLNKHLEMYSGIIGDHS